MCKYAIESEFGYWNADLKTWVQTLFGSTWYCSMPFADGQAEFLREKFCTETYLVKIFK